MADSYPLQLLCVEGVQNCKLKFFSSLSVGLCMYTIAMALKLGGAAKDAGWSTVGRLSGLFMQASPLWLAGLRIWSGGAVCGESLREGRRSVRCDGSIPEHVRSLGVGTAFPKTRKQSLVCSTAFVQCYTH